MSVLIFIMMLTFHLTRIRDRYLCSVAKAFFLSLCVCTEQTVSVYSLIEIFHIHDAILPFFYHSVTFGRLTCVSIYQDLCEENFACKKYLFIVV